MTQLDWGHVTDIIEPGMVWWELEHVHRYCSHIGSTLCNKVEGMLIDGATYRESYASALLCLTEECGPSRPLQLASVKLKDSMNVHLLLSYHAHVKYGV
jgi:hypothetical protein